MSFTHLWDRDRDRDQGFCRILPSLEDGLGSLLFPVRFWQNLEGIPSSVPSTKDAHVKPVSSASVSFRVIRKEKGTFFLFLPPILLHTPPSSLRASEGRAGWPFVEQLTLWWGPKQGSDSQAWANHVSTGEAFQVVTYSSPAAQWQDLRREGWPCCFSSPQ